MDRIGFFSLSSVSLPRASLVDSAVFVWMVPVSSHEFSRKQSLRQHFDGRAS